MEKRRNGDAPTNCFAHPHQSTNGRNSTMALSGSPPALHLDPSGGDRREAGRRLMTCKRAETPLELECSQGLEQGGRFSQRVASPAGSDEAVKPLKLVDPLDRVENVE
jgi:hypothetical protein